MIKVKNASVRFHKGTALEHVALDRVSLEIAAGEWVMLVGSNGAGKSTLLNALAGDLPLDDGLVLVDDIDVTQQPSHVRAKHIARVFQDPALGTCAALSIEENLALALDRDQRRGFRAALTHPVRAELKDVLADLNMGLERRMHEPMGTLSGGQRQAVGLLMATLRPAKLLLLDEHTAALDPKMTELVMALTERVVRKQRMTTIMITHNMTHAATRGDRCIVMHQGNIIQDLRGEQRASVMPA